MHLLRSLVAAAAIVAGITTMHAGDRRVLTDLDAAKALSAKEGKELVVEFSGRTWCRPCQSLLKEVIPSPEFAAFAAERVVVHLDYPRKSERTSEKIADNPELAKLVELMKDYRIEGFPTVVLLDPSGKEIGRVLGYEDGMGAAAFLAELTEGK